LHEQGRRWPYLVSLVVLAALVATLIVAGSGSAKGVSRQRQLEAAAARVVKPPAPVLPAAGKVLGGFTSQHLAVVLEIAKKDKRVNLAGTAFNLTCTSGDQIVIPDGFQKLPIGKNGAVSVKFEIPASGPPSSTTTTLLGGTDTLTGKLNAKNATFSGTWELQLNFSVPNMPEDQCDSGRVTFKAVL
jgi:hypothetical protein